MSALAMELTRDHLCVGYSGIVYTCGNCLTIFRTLCQLSNHFEEDHLGSTTFVYNRNSRTAFPKFGFSCMASQTDITSRELLQTSGRSELDVLVPASVSNLTENNPLSKSEVKDTVLDEFSDDTNVIQVVSEESVALFKVLYKTGENKALVMGDPLMLLARLVSEQPSNGQPDEIPSEVKDLVVEALSKAEDDNTQEESVAITDNVHIPVDTGNVLPKVKMENFSVIGFTKMETEPSEITVPEMRKAEQQNISPIKKLETVNINVHEDDTDSALAKLPSCNEECTIDSNRHDINMINTPDIESDLAAMAAVSKAIKDDGTEISEDAEHLSPRKPPRKKVKTDDTKPNHSKKEIKIHIIKRGQKCSIETMAVEESSTDVKADELCYHCSSSHPGKTWTCTSCQKSFKCDELFLVHVNLQMFQNLEKSGIEVEKCEICNSPLCPTEPNVCSFCGNEYVCRKQLLKHVRCHHKKFKCDKCSKTFNQKSSLEVHAFVHQPKNSGNTRFKCQICDAEYPLQSRLDSHTRNIHMGERNAKCEDCGKQFFNAAGLAAHVKVHAEPQLLCNLCPKAFRCQSNLKKHLDSHNSDNHCACSICGKKFISQLNLDLHFRNVHSREKRYECGECHVRFFKHSGLKSHIFTHHSNTLYICEVCRKSFKDPYQYNKHLDLHKDNVSLDCTICQKTFGNEYNLKKHIAVRHSNKKDFECEICQNKFARSDYLQRHMKSHFDGTFVCSECPKRCKTRTELKQHMRTHDENATKDFHCAICNRHFAHSSSLGRHMKQTHNVEVEVAQFLVPEESVPHSGTILVQDGQIQISSALLMDIPTS